MILVSFLALVPAVILAHTGLGPIGWTIGDWRLVGRSQADAPEIDGQVYVELDEAPADGTMGPGTFVRAHITDYDAHDLVGELARDA